MSSLVYVATTPSGKQVHGDGSSLANRGKLVSKFYILYFFLHRGLIRGGDTEGRLTDLNGVDADFKRYCCDQNGGCDRYLSKRPSIPVGRADATKCKYCCMQNYGQISFRSRL